MAIVVYKFGLGQPVDWDENSAQMLFEQNRFWNLLVEIHRAHQERYHALIASDSEVSAVQKLIDQALTRRAELHGARKEIYRDQRKRIAVPELDSAVAQLDSNILEFRKNQLPLRVAARKRLAEDVRANEDAHYKAVKKARQECGLWWSNYDTILRRYELARSRAMRDGAELRFKRFTGEGQFSAWLRGGPSVKTLSEGKRTQVEFRLPPDEAYEEPSRGARRRMQMQASLTIATTYTGRKRSSALTFPMRVHRALPPDATVKLVTVSRKRVGTKFHWTAAVTCEVRAEIPVHRSAGSCGINFGFRSVTDGLRVATLVGENGVVSHLILSRTWLLQAASLDKIQSDRDHSAKAALAAVRTLPHIVPEALADEVAKLRRSPKVAAHRLASLVLHWRRSYGDWEPELLAVLEQWRREDKLRLERSANLRLALAARRTEVYRLWAQRTTMSFSAIGLGAMNLKDMAKRPSDAQKPGLNPNARINQAYAAVTYLQAELRRSALKVGCTVHAVKSAYSVTCHVCGAQNSASDELIRVCQHCDAVWDQDHNAAVNICRSTKPAPNDLPLDAGVAQRYDVG